MDEDFDIIVIGGGAGGGTLAALCAAAGKRVLLTERGAGVATKNPEIQQRADGRKLHDESATLIKKHPYDDRTIQINGTAARLYMGGLLGGGTSVYGGALLRPSPADFSPGKYYGDRIPREIHEWPIDFESFEPYLKAAERLYHVADVRCSRFSPSANPNRTAHRTIDAPRTRDAEFQSGHQLETSLPLAKINESLMQTAWKSGLNPYRLPLAIDSSKCLRCDNCAGFVCPTGARRSSSQLVQDSVERGESLTLKTRHEADRLERGPNGRLKGVWLKNRADGSVRLARAKRYVLAAGAIGSSALLLRSDFDHPLIGRNYMMHYSPIAIGVFACRTGASQTFVKQVGYSDYYFGTEDLPEKMGIVQSLPAPGPLMMAKSGMRFVPRWMLNILRSRMLPLVGIVEDLPSPENRVSVDTSGAIRLRHEFSDFDRTRGAEMSRQMSKLLKSTGAMHCVTGLAPSQEHVAHQCGTLRFGTSRTHAVADPQCRLFDQPDVFVADGSFMPSSLGVGPSLTIIGNAMRVAEIVASEV